MSWPGAARSILPGTVLLVLLAVMAGTQLAEAAPVSAPAPVRGAPAPLAAKAAPTVGEAKVVPAGDKAVPAEVQAPAWVVRASAPRALQVGERAQLEVLVEARAGYHLNEDYPINFRPTPTEQTAFERVRIDRKDGIIVERCKAEPSLSCRARAPVAFMPEVGGSARVGGTLAFSACDASQCLIEKVQVAATVEVRARKR